MEFAHLVLIQVKSWFQISAINVMRPVSPVLEQQQPVPAVHQAGNRTIVTITQFKYSF